MWPKWEFYKRLVSNKEPFRINSEYLPKRASKADPLELFSGVDEEAGFVTVGDEPTPCEEF